MYSFLGQAIVRETLDKLELVHDLAALVGDLLLRAVEGQRGCYPRSHTIRGCRNIRIELFGAGTLLEGNLGWNVSFLYWLIEMV